MPATRLSRAAAYALGTGRARAVVLATGAALAAATAGCSVGTPLYGAPADLGVEPTDSGSAQDSGAHPDSGTSDAGTIDAGTDSGAITTHYGTPPVDGGLHQDAGVDLGGPMADYGSPPHT